MKMSKKGISPLIATVLILGFTVALAAIIMNWGTKFTRDIQQSTSESATANIACSQDVVLNIRNVCRTTSGADNIYNILVANDGKADIVKLNVRLYKSESDVASDTLTETIGKFSLKTLMSTKAPTGGVKKVELIPSIQIEGKTVTCSSNIISYGDVTGSDFGMCA